MVSVEVRESEIEDIFAQYPILLRRILELTADIFLVARQKILPSGRLDLVYSHLSDLLLVELKVEPFQESFLNQVTEYRNDLVSLQQRGEFVRGDLNAVLLCPRVTREEQRLAAVSEVAAVPYKGTRCRGDRFGV